MRGREGYVGGLLEFYNERTFRYWGDLEEALRTGGPQNETKYNGRPLFYELYREPARLEQFLAAMSCFSRPNFLALAEAFDFGPYRTLCDAGGAAAELSCAVAARHPQLRCTSFDLRAVEPFARATITRRGLADRVTTAAGDFFRDPLPRADVITMGMILHDWNLEKKKALIRAAYDAAGRWRVHRRREPDRRSTARERLRSPRVAHDADRVRRRLRLHRSRLPELVLRSGLSTLRGAAPRRSDKRRDRIQVASGRGVLCFR